MKLLYWLDEWQALTQKESPKMCSRRWMDRPDQLIFQVGINYAESLSRDRLGI